jgi:hypothetical protein
LRLKQRFFSANDNGGPGSYNSVPLYVKIIIEQRISFKIRYLDEFASFRPGALTISKQPQKERIMGDKGGKKDKEKSQKQSNEKHKQKEKQKVDKQPAKKV